MLISDIYSRETNMLIVINRHGARHSYSKFENEGDKGELTPNGLRMAYLLGKHLKNKYNPFFTERFSFQQNEVIASGLNRCRQTAQAIMLGIYDFGSFNDELKINPQFIQPEWNKFDYNSTLKPTLPDGFQPIPIHSFLEEENRIFQTDRILFCPKMAKRHLVEIPEEVAPILLFVNKFLPKIMNEKFDYRLFVNKTKMEKLEDLSFLDFGISQRFRGNDLGLNDEDYSIFERIDTAVMNYQFFRFSETNKYMFTELGRVILSKFESFESDLMKNNSKNKRFALFSGHDINIFSILLAAKIAKFDCLDLKGECTVNPRFGSFVTFEVFNENNLFFVETMYNGEVINFCFGKDQSVCPLKDFIEYFKTLIYDSDIEEIRNRFCREEEDLSGYYLDVMLCFGLVFNLIVIGIFLKKRQYV